MVNYNKAMIYKIVPKDLDSKYCYIGSTVDFKKRKSSHKTVCNNPYDKGYNIPLYKHIRDNGGWNAFEMILIEFFSCETKLELLKRERESKELYNDNLGREIPGRTQKEYYQDNQEKIAEKRKEYYQDNQEKIAEQKKEYYQDNKKTILEKKKERIECPTCNCYIRKYDFKRHTQTNKHIANL
jgi:hypothetical protein